jgi:hypothetical protein
LITNIELSSEYLSFTYEKPAESENYIKKAKFDMAVGHPVKIVLGK